MEIYRLCGDGVLSWGEMTGRELDRVEKSQRGKVRGGKAPGGGGGGGSPGGNRLDPSCYMLR